MTAQEQPDPREDGEMTNADIAATIARLEQQHGMTSAEFIERWKVDDVPDTFETNLWRMLLHKEYPLPEQPRHLSQADADDRAALLAEIRRLSEELAALKKWAEVASAWLPQGWDEPGDDAYDAVYGDGEVNDE